MFVFKTGRERVGHGDTKHQTLIFFHHIYIYILFIYFFFVDQADKEGEHLHAKKGRASPQNS